MANDRLIYSFGGKGADGDTTMRTLLGGKGAGLAEMARLGIPVPPGFTIPTTACCYYHAHSQKFPPALKEAVQTGIARIEKLLGRKFGDSSNPLLVSVRSGAAQSMPGMMETILNLGLNEDTEAGLVRKTGNARFARDSHERLRHMYTKVVGVAAIPKDPWEQLWGAIRAVFESWNTKRAVEYRRIYGIPDDGGTAVNIQAMVFGNSGNRSATGVAFTRNPSTGDNAFFGEFLINAQGEDVVAGIRTPQPIAEMQKVMPKAYAELKEITKRLEGHFRDMQDIEFTVEDDKLWMLQTRTGKRTARAAVKLATDMVAEKLITPKEAVGRVQPEQIDQLLHPMLDPSAPRKAIGKGLAASPGAAVGQIVFDADDAVAWAHDGKAVVLVRLETSPDDIQGMHVAQGFLTARGGMTCVSGETKLLTSLGFITAEDAFDHYSKLGTFKILSYDNGQKKTAWRTVRAVGRRKALTKRIEVSQTGKAARNYLRLTDDHKIYTVRNRQLVKYPIKEIVLNGECVCIPDRIPVLQEGIKDHDLAYLVGAIFTDVHIRLNHRRGSVVFTQKPTAAKQEFISEVKRCFESVFSIPLEIERIKKTTGFLQGRKIEGEATDLISCRKFPAEKLIAVRENISSFILGQDEEGLWRFLAGAMDGNGTYNSASSRASIYVSKQWLLEGIVLACLRLGILPQVTNNRHISNVQIVERLETLLSFTKRVRGVVNGRMYGTKFFSARSLFLDRWKSMNLDGKMGEIIKRNLLIDREKVKQNYIPICNPKEELKAILESEFRMQRVSLIEDRIDEELVYNFEVDVEDEINKNFIVFTSRYTPLLISNSHAAVVARGMGKSCVVGCNDMEVSVGEKSVCFSGGAVLKEGDWLTIDGSTGEVIQGKVPLVTPTPGEDFKTLMAWADGCRRLKVRANADTPEDAALARKMGAEGIGLCRTEHMFFAEDRLGLVREMIVAGTTEARQKALSQLLPIQRKDFKGILHAMHDLPVTIRLLDPPLHEFLPQEEGQQKDLSRKIGVPVADLERRLVALHEMNPMLGHRGCRLAVTYPEILEMQVRAIMEAACQLQKNEKIKVLPEIELPLIAHVKELEALRVRIDAVCRAVMEENAVVIPYKVGTMIELPRAAITAEELAPLTDFFSFGTNDLTQTTFGLSRDDAGKFLPQYLEQKILASDPFVSIDTTGVGILMSFAVEHGRKVRPSLEIGICGEHGGDPASILFCEKIGLDYVSCSPYRVPVARLAAAQAALSKGQATGPAATA